MCNCSNIPCFGTCSMKKFNLTEIILIFFLGVFFGMIVSKFYIKKQKDQKND